MLARLFVTLSLIVLASCSDDYMSKPPEPFGNFSLGYDIVVAENSKQVGPSRTATAEEWQAALKTAIDKRMGRYQGDKLYHLGIGVDAYALAIPGIPVVLKPRSVLSVTVSVWDDTAQRKINAEPKVITVFEPFSPETFIGSGLTRTKDQQMQALSDNVARKINEWLVENKAWFTPEAVAARALLGPSPGAATKGAKKAAGN